MNINHSMVQEKYNGNHLTKRSAIPMQASHREWWTKVPSTYSLNRLISELLCFLSTFELASSFDQNIYSQIKVNRCSTYLSTNLSHFDVYALGTIPKVHCSYVVQQMSWQSDKHSSFDLANPSDPVEFSHWLLQFEILRRKLASFLVPDVSFLSFGFCPGTMGVFPLFHIVGSFSAALDASAPDVPKTTADPMPNANLLNRSLLLPETLRFGDDGCLWLFIDNASVNAIARTVISTKSKESMIMLRCKVYRKKIESRKSFGHWALLYFVRLLFVDDC